MDLGIKRFGLAGGLIVLALLIITSLNFSNTSEEISLEEVHKLFPLLPRIGPEETMALNYIPPDALGGETNALDAAAVKFVDNSTHSVKAVAAVIRCLNKTYEHDHSICNRFHGYTLESASAVPLPVNDTLISWFWFMSLKKGRSLDKAIVFAVFVDEDNSSIVVDSRWLHDFYPNPIDKRYEYALSFEIWAYAFEDVYGLLNETLKSLRSYGKLSFINTAKPISAKAFIKSVEYSKNAIKLEVQSTLSEDIIVNFNIGMRQHNNRDYSFAFDCNRTLKPGYNVVEIPAKNMLDAVVSMQVDGFLDKVYVGTGFWFTFSDPQSTSTLIMGNDTPFEAVSKGNLAFASSAEMVGTVRTPGGYVALGYALGPHGKPVDLGEYNALTFYARGNDKLYDVLITSDSINDFDYHRFTFIAPNEGKQFIVPLSSFKQKGSGISVRFSGNDVRTVTWASVNASPGQTLDLFIGNASFI